ncbi:putative ribonuclease H-like domain-containing protein [Tanacetum coccineum]|uniref:Ribonuclease H-like domain-containing protein n=1 Tax=Tanacetum coccineum TaxID=301880 RepID=A0ABQ5AAG7_9ASTR
MMERELGEGYSFIKKKCFVCGSLSHLIRDCDFYEKKMAREAEIKKQRVFNTGNGVAKPVWNNPNMVNHANHFVPRPVQLNAVRPNSNFVRPNVNTGRANVNSDRANVNSVRQNVNSVRSNVNTDHPLKNMEDRGIFDSGCSAHMTGNKDHLDDFEECKWGSVTFGEERPMTVDDLLQLVPKLITKKVKKIEAVLKRRHVVLTDSEDEYAKNSSKQGRNLQEEGLDEMVRSIMKKKSEEFETPTQGKTSGEADISPEGLEAAETLAKFLTQRTKTYTRKVKTGLRRKLDADEVSTGEGISDPKSSMQTRSRVQQHSGAHALEEPKKIFEALKDDSWVEAMQEELLQFRLQQVWILVDLPHGAKVIGTKWVYRNKRDKRGVYEEVYVSQPPGFVDPDHPKKVYKVVKALYGLHQAPRAWYATLSTFLETHGYRRGTIDKTLFIKKDKKDIMLVQVYVDDIIFGSTRKSWCDEFEALMKGRFQMSSMGELIFFLGLQVKQKIDGLFISQDKYVAEMLKKFDLASVKTAITPMETNMALTKDEEADDVDVHLYRSMIAYSDSDYAGENLDKKSTTGGCQFLGRRLILWQCKKQTIVATSTTETEYVAAASCYGQVLWIQNQMMDYGFNFLNTKIHIDNESTICIVKNPVYHSKTKHIEIRHHFIRDSYEKKLIRVEKIHTDFNVADLLTKAFDGPRFNFLVVNIGMINP